MSNVFLVKEILDGDCFKQDLLGNKAYNHTSKVGRHSAIDFKFIKFIRPGILTFGCENVNPEAMSWILSKGEGVK